MVSAKMGEDLKDIEVIMRGDICEVTTEVMWLLKNVGEQLEKATGVSARTHIVNMCKLIVSDDMNMSQTFDLAMKTMNGEEVPLDDQAAQYKITELQDRLVSYLRNYREAHEMFPDVVNPAYDTGWNNALCWVLHLTGKDVNKADYGLND